MGLVYYILVSTQLYAILELPANNIQQQYVCPPCGLNCDQLSFDQPGRCEVCLMHLTTVTEIEADQATTLQKLKRLGVFNFLIGLGIAQGLFLLVVLFFGKSSSYRHPANRYLAWLIIGIISGCCYYLLLEFRVFYQYPVLSFLPLKMSYLIGPSLYLYVASAIGMRQTWKQTMAHYFPAALVAVIGVLMMFLGTSPVSRFYAMYDLYVLGMAGFAHVLVYLGMTYLLLSRYKSALNNNYSQIPPSQLSWLRNLAIFVFLLLTLIATYVVVTLASPEIALGRYLFLYWILASLFVYWISLSVYQQPQLFLVTDKLIGAQSVVLKKEVLNPYLEALRNSMEMDALYLNPDLTRQTLADHIKINPNTLSHILNKTLHKSFHDFVNEYRVKEVMRKIEKPEFLHYTLEGIAYESGFNSKSTFNAIFKKFSGKTPRQYKKEVAPL